MSPARLMFAMLFLGFVCWNNLHAQTINAGSCSGSDVQKAFNSVSMDGVTISVPSGTCTWTAPVVPSCHSVTLQGAGSSNTHIIVNLGSGYGNDALFVSGCSGKQFRITGFDWQYESADAFGLFMFTGGSGLSLRIDHNTIEPFPSNPGYGRFMSFRVPCISPGCVVDHNTITDAGSIVENLQSGDANGGDMAWQQPMPFETVNAVYYEDNVMGNPSYNSHQVDMTDCDDGGAYVFRHNTLNSDVLGNHGYDSVANGCRMENGYLNTLNPAGVANWGIQYRGGTGVQWSNVFTSDAVSLDFGITNYRSNSNGFVGTTGHGHCDGTNPVDGNANPPVSYGWPCYEQIGRGSGTSGGLTSQPLYEWDNCKTALGCTGTSNQVTATIYNAGSGTNWTPFEIVQNRDFYDSVSSFNGTAGVGIGPLGSRPGTCTTGVSYWAIDMTTLYQCSSTNTWTAFYTPFTYPHPLQGGGNASGPKPPTALAATVM